MTISHQTTAHFTDALTGKPFTHLHYDSHSRDCDGRYDRAYVQTPKPGETLRDLWEWLVRHETKYLHSAGEEYPASLTVSDRLHETYAEPDYSTENFDTPRVGVFAYPVLSVYKRDEEGGSSEQWSMCSGEFCVNDSGEFRDHTAEAAGY